MSAQSRKRRQGCPVCARPAAAASTPFCSQGCRDRDLLNWLGDAYCVPGRPDGEEHPDFTSDGLDSGRGPPL